MGSAPSLRATPLPHAEPQPAPTSADTYRTLQQHGTQWVSRQRGLFRSIADESLSPPDHLRQALGLRLRNTEASQGVPPYVRRATLDYSSSSLEDLRRHCPQAIAYWGARSRALPYRDDAPFHAALVQEMDHHLDLFGRGPLRFRGPLDGVQVAVDGARVVGSVAYDHVFARHATAPPAPESLQTLFGRQEVVHRDVLASLSRSRGADRAILWESAVKEVSQGFAVAHVGRPAPVEVPDVFYHRFVAHQERWDLEPWVQKPRACDDATANGVNACLQALSLADLATLDRFAASARDFMQTSRARGYGGAFRCLTFDHDQTYRRVRRQCPFRCLVPVISPGGPIRSAGGDTFVPAGGVVYLEFSRLLFGEAGAVAGYCCPARVVAVALARVLLVPADHYVDDFSAWYWAEDSSCPGDVRSFPVDVLRFHLHPDKGWQLGDRILHLGMQVELAEDGLWFGLSANRRRKYLAYFDHYLQINRLSNTQAAELGGRLA